MTCFWGSRKVVIDSLGRSGTWTSGSSSALVEGKGPTWVNITSCSASQEAFKGSKTLHLQVPPQSRPTPNTGKICWSMKRYFWQGESLHGRRTIDDCTNTSSKWVWLKALEPEDHRGTVNALLTLFISSNTKTGTRRSSQKMHLPHNDVSSNDS